MNKALKIGSLMRLIETRLWLQILIAMVLGVSSGLLLSPYGFALISEDLAYSLALWIKLPGDIFLRLIQMVMVPLVTCSIILGICSSSDTEKLKRLGLRIAPYFFMTTVVAVTIGICLAYLIKPGLYIDASLVQEILSSTDVSVVSSLDLQSQISIPERIAELIPSNPEKSQLNREMLQIVIFAIFTGVALLTVKKEIAKPLINLCITGRAVAMKVVGWAMLIVPLAVFSLLCDITIRVGVKAILGMSIYVATVILGLIALLLFYLLIVALVTKKSPFKFLLAIKEVQLLAFSTSSSAAVMPLSIKTAEEKLKVDSSVVEFIVPLGATMNMDGTAIYQVIAAIFLTQVFGIELSLTSLIILSFTTVGASIGSPSSPGVGIVILAIILGSIGVPASGVALIIGVDRILDMCRTAINVTGDMTACVVMGKLLQGRK